MFLVGVGGVLFTSGKNRGFASYLKDLFVEFYVFVVWGGW